MPYLFAISLINSTTNTTETRTMTMPSHTTMPFPRENQIPLSNKSKTRMLTSLAIQYPTGLTNPMRTQLQTTSDFSQSVCSIQTPNTTVQLNLTATTPRNWNTSTVH